jgi:hypothetical protein
MLNLFQHPPSLRTDSAARPVDPENKPVLAYWDWLIVHDLMD